MTNTEKLFTLLLLIFCLPTLGQQVDFKSSNLPIVVINTHGQTIPDDPKIDADMGIINNASGARNNLTDPFNEFNSKIGIEIRGQSSQMFPMKSYSIELRDSNNDDMDAPLFGLPKESDWVMYAPYTDKTLMRNFLAYTMSNSLGHWAAHCRYVEVVLNGQYIGIYVFMEKIKRGGGRVSIAKLKEDDNSGDNVTGGYIFSIDKDADAWFSSYPPPNSTVKSIRFAYVYPKAEDITTQQAAYIKKDVDDFEGALASANFQDTAKGFRKYADENSFIDYFIVNEISRNVDAYRISSFFHKDRNSINPKIIAGPVWDYDIAFRNANYCVGSDTTGWAYQFNYVCKDDGHQVPFWWNRFMQDSLFKAHLYCRWTEVRSTVLSNQNINHWIDSIYNVVGEAEKRHFTQWPVLGKYIWPNPQPIPSTYAGEISTLKSWLAARLSWLDRNIEKAGPCAAIPAGSNGSFEIKVWPNPVNNPLNLHIISFKDQTVQLVIVNTIGQRVLQSSVPLLSGNNTTQINTGSWGRGVYIIKVFSNDGTKKTFTIEK
jgi:hypothetical protein